MIKSREKILKLRVVKFMSIFFIYTCIFIFTVCLLRLIVFINDQHFIDEIRYLYLYNEEGVIYGKETIEERSYNDKLILFLHGYNSHPGIYDEIIEKIDKDEYDVYAPLLPDHGRDLERLAKHSITKWEKYIRNTILQESNIYDEVTIVTHGFSGSIMLKLMADDNMLNNVKYRLISPAISFYNNNFRTVFLLNTLGLFTNYSYYETSKHLGDFMAIDNIALDKELMYWYVPALREIFDYNEKYGKKVLDVGNPVSIIIARNDLRVNVQHVNKYCLYNIYCNLEVLGTGNYYLFWSRHQDLIIDWILAPDDPLFD